MSRGKGTCHSLLALYQAWNFEVGFRPTNAPLWPAFLRLQGLPLASVPQGLYFWGPRKVRAGSRVPGALLTLLWIPEPRCVYGEAMLEHTDPVLLLAGCHIDCTGCHLAQDSEGKGAWPLHLSSITREQTWGDVTVRGTVSLSRSWGEDSVWSSGRRRCPGGRDM